MKFKTGDKVKFLNEKGGGIITKIISPTMVNVMIEDGFEVPVLISEVIPAESSDPRETLFNQNFSIPAGKIPNIQQETDDMPERISKLQKYSSLNNKPNGIYLAYLPQDQVWLLKDALDLFIVNYTPFDVLYSFILKDEQNSTFEGIDYGSIEPFSKIHIETIQREQLDEWLNGFVQVLFFKENDTKIQMPLHVPFKIKPVRFMTKESYMTTNFMEEKGVFIHLGGAVSIEQTTQNLAEKDTEVLQNLQSRPIKIIEKEKIINQYQTDRNTAEVDLHIESIVDDHSKLNNVQILEKQKQLFIKCLEGAIEEKLQKIIFIHGVGNGILKQEIHAILKQYPNIHYFDASMQKYGCGATEVLIKSSTTL